MMDYFTVKYAGLKFAGALAIIALQPITFFGSKPAKAQGVSEERLQKMQSSTYAGCFQTQRNDVGNKVFTDDAIKDFCQCYSKALINNSITHHDLEELVKLYQVKAAPEKVMTILLKGRDINKIADACSEEIFK